TTPHPRTDEVAGRLLTLPLFPGLGENGVDAVCDALATAVSVVYVGDASASNGNGLGRNARRPSGSHSDAETSRLQPYLWRPRLSRTCRSSRRCRRRSSGS